MNRSLLFKLGTIALLILLLMIPLLLIDGLVNERQGARDDVLRDIARSSSYAQQVTGPIMVVPYRKKVLTWKTRKDSEERYQEESIEQGRLYFLPERFLLDGDVRTELRYRGIYQARLYHSDSQINGEFKVPANYGISDVDAYWFGEPFIAVGISDVRGIGNDLKLQLNGASLSFEPGSGDDSFGSGVHVALPAHDRRNEQTYTLSLIHI